MTEWRDISSARTDEPVLVWLPALQAADVAIAQVSHAYGMEIIEWVDQWNNEPYETSAGVRVQPTLWKPIQPPKDTPA